jgi:ribosomal protein S27E
MTIINPADREVRSVIQFLRETNPVDCEERSVIQFLKETNPVDCEVCSAIRILKENNAADCEERSMIRFLQETNHVDCEVCSVILILKETNPADCEVRSVNRFLKRKDIRPSKIRRHLVEVYGKGVVNMRNVPKWCRFFNGEAETCSPTRGLNARLLSPRISKIKPTPTLAKTGASLPMSYMKFSRMSGNLPSTRLSQFNSDAEQFEPDAFQYPRKRRQAEVKEIVADWLNEQTADCYDEGILKSA